MRLEPLAGHHLNALLALKLPEEQQPFTARPATWLERARGDPQLLPVVITADGAAVGLFARSTGLDRDRYLLQPDPDAVALTSLILMSAFRNVASAHAPCNSSRTS
ncbi:hypothetical protein [Deinococcus frigens]|uniref:hypothetical protein n=1 Tax=Deinococcus frigens TaxID=249403 RepID=UPI0004984256|nr:hypothetical protein [Deinococcus frigens]